MKRCYEFGPEQVQTLDGLSRELSVTRTNILRDGLRVIRMAAAAAKLGGQLAIVGADGKVSPLLGPWNDVGPRPAA